MNDIVSHSEQKRLFRIGNLSIFMIGLGFAVRANIAKFLQADIFDHIDAATSATMVGEAIGITFLGFAITLLVGSALVDWFGCKKILVFSALGYIFGSLLVVVASLIDPGAIAIAFVFIGLLLTGLGWGAVEAASNPMVATIDPEHKVHRLNVLHAWWPAGIVVGGLLGVQFSAIDIPWQANLLVLTIPGIALLVMVMRAEFPPTERVAAGVSYKEMFAELFKQPMFYVFWGAMWLTTMTELVPGQWVDLTLSKVVGMKGILLLVYVSALMFVMRHFAGTLAKRFSSLGILFGGSVFAALGLFLLSRSSSPGTALFAATLWGIGVCYMWPTMVACVAERFPRGGALFMGLMGFAGGLSIKFTLPILGRIFDEAKLEAAGGIEAFTALTGEPLDAVLRIAAVQSFEAIVYVPLLLLPIFALIWLIENKFSKLGTHSSLA